jgi:hypothetical protein
VPRAPLHVPGVTVHAMMSRTMSAGITPPSSLLRAHASVLHPPRASVIPSDTKSWQVAVSPCWAKDLPDVVSAHLSLRAWTPTPAARVVHVPVSSHTTAAFPPFGPGRRSTMSVQRLQYGALFEAAVIRSCSGPQVCSPPRSLLPLRRTPHGSRGFLRPSLSWVVTSPRPGYACRPNRAIDGRGLSPHKMRSLVGCSPNAGAHLLPEAGATQERTLEAVRCSALFGVASGTDAGLAHPRTCHIFASCICSSTA